MGNVDSVLFVNACVRGESRTLHLARRLLARLNRPVQELRLCDVQFPVADQAFLTVRDRLLSAGRIDHSLFDLARQFAGAGTIVMAAPYWDLSFPAGLKQYLEQVNVVGVTFKYSPDGVPIGLCRAKRLYYVTTAGGPFAPDEYGFGYVQALAHNYYGIADVRQLKAVGLDLAGADVPAILREAEKSIIDITGGDTYGQE